MRKVIALSLMLCFVLSFPVQAKNIWDMADSPKYGEKAGGMFVRGVINAASCFVDMPVGAVKGAQKENNQFMGAIGGFATGAMCTILRAASGVIDVATFWVPGFNGLPVCRSYGDCLACAGKKQETASTTYVAPQGTQAVVYQEQAPASQPASKGRMKYIKK
jgi:putative exosortase-associated protein (TIGR04073 family)